MLQWPDLEITLGLPVLRTLRVFGRGLAKGRLEGRKIFNPLDLYPSLLEDFDFDGLYLRNTTQ